MKNPKLNDSETIALFLCKINELRESRLIKTKVKCYSFQVFMDNSNLDYYTLPLPPEEFVESYLLRFRHFVLSKSPINIFRVLKIAHRLSKGEKDKEIIMFIRKHFSTKLHRDRSNNFKKFFICKTLDDQFRLFLNGKYFHFDNILYDKLKTLTIDNYKLNMTMFLSGLYSFSESLFFTDIFFEKIINFRDCEN